VKSSYGNISGGQIRRTTHRGWFMEKISPKKTYGIIFKEDNIWIFSCG